MTKEQIIKEYLSELGRKGGSVRGPQKARQDESGALRKNIPNPERALG
jgi:hypothetical protein